jgi:glycosyltransferase involved in cell wall biosynthesis
MIVGQFSESYPPLMDGVGMVTKHYTHWLNEKYGRACAVTVRVPGHEDEADGPEVLRVSSIPIPGMPPYRAPLPKLSFGVRHKLSNTAFDIVHSHAPFRLGRLARSIARRRGIPIVTTFHSKYRDDFEKALPTAGMRSLAMRYILDFYNSVDVVWVPNRATIATLREYGYEGPVDVMYNGTDLALPDDTDEYRARGEALAGVPREHKMLLYIGQHRWEKNLKLMLESLARVKRSVPDFSMVFVGQGYAEDELRDLVRSLGLEPNVKFLGVVRDREVIKQLYARTDLFLFPSLYDTSPLTLREAAAFHVPTLLVEGASASEGIQDGVNGFLAAGSVESYGDKIVRILEDDGQRMHVGDGAYKMLFRTWEQVVDEVHERYQVLIDQSRRTMDASA